MENTLLISNYPCELTYLLNFISFSPYLVQRQQFSTAENLGNSWMQNWSGGVTIKFRLLMALAELCRFILLIF